MNLPNNTAPTIQNTESQLMSNKNPMMLEPNPANNRPHMRIKHKAIALIEVGNRSIAIALMILPQQPDVSKITINMRIV